MCEWGHPGEKEERAKKGVADGRGREREVERERQGEMGDLLRKGRKQSREREKRKKDRERGRERQRERVGGEGQQVVGELCRCRIAVKVDPDQLQSVTL